MISNIELKKYCENYLNVDSFKDYCPNGLQIEGREKINKIISGVSANLALIESAIKKNADAIFVHHGFFWDKEDPAITGFKRNRIALLLKHNINLFAFHLPLDAHPVVGNNIKLAKLLNINNPMPIENSLVWQGKVDTDIGTMLKKIEGTLGQKPLAFGNKNKQIRKIAWCSGGAQDYIKKAIELGADCYLTGEVSESIPAIAKENNIAFISAGHHATEKYGIQSFCQHLENKFDLEHKFINIDNVV